MKVVLIILFGFFVFSCNKNTKFEPTPEYLSIAGEWESIDGDNYTTIDIEKNGKINIVRNDQRNKSLKTSKIHLYEEAKIINGFAWDLLICLEEDESGFNSSEGFYINPTADTLSVGIGHALYDNPNISNTINFTRK